jgi:hypothetical protein
MLAKASGNVSQHYWLYSQYNWTVPAFSLILAVLRSYWCLYVSIVVMCTEVQVMVLLQAHPEGTNPATGENVPWTSGLIGQTESMEDDPKQVMPQACLHAKVHARVSEMDLKIPKRWRKRVAAISQSKIVAMVILKPLL